MLRLLFELLTMLLWGAFVVLSANSALEAFPGGPKPRRFVTIAGSIVGFLGGCTVVVFVFERVLGYGEIDLRIIPWIPALPAALLSPLHPVEIAAVALGLYGGFRIYCATLKHYRFTFDNPLPQVPLAFAFGSPYIWVSAKYFADAGTSDTGSWVETLLAAISSPPRLLEIATLTLCLDGWFWMFWTILMRAHVMPDQPLPRVPFLCAAATIPVLATVLAAWGWELPFCSIIGVAFIFLTAAVEGRLPKDDRTEPPPSWGGSL